MVYVTVQGDTWDKIAKDHLASEFRMDHLTAANPQHFGTILFPAGIRINIPELPEDAPQDDDMPSWRVEP